MSRNMTSFNNSETYPTWNEDDKVGAEIKGVITDKRTITTAKGEFPLMVIDTGGGKMQSVWCARKIMTDFFNEMSEGTYVEIQYLGKEQTKQGRDFHAYKLDYDKDTLNVAQVFSDDMDKINA